MSRHARSLGHVELFVPDPRAERDFYRAAFDFPVRSEQQGGMIWLEAWGTELLLRPGKPALAPAYGDSGVALVAYARDFTELMDRVVALGATPGEPDGAPDCPTFRTPGGTWWQVVDPTSHEE
jgi:catechol 2,3-dioxygenase-like lactoylglutathione lyase family enzyme